jgi:hypothetical protein
MTSIGDFRILLEGELLRTRGNVLDKLKRLLNHLNIARLRVPAARNGSSSIEVLLSLLVVGRLRGDGSFQPHGDIVLPWCRQRPWHHQDAERDSPITPPVIESDAVLVQMIDDVVRPIFGEGHGILYAALEKWWSLAARVPMPWPHPTLRPSVRAPLLMNLRSCQILPVARQAIRHTIGPHPTGLHGARAILFHFVPAPPGSALHTLSGITNGHTPGTLVCLVLQQDTSVARAVSGPLSRLLETLGGIAMATHAEPASACDECDAFQGKDHCDPLARALCTLHEDLNSNALRSTYSHHYPRLEVDDLLIARRDVQYPARKQRVRYLCFPRQFVAMRRRLLARLSEIHPVEHVLRCACLIAKTQGAQRPGESQQAAETRRASTVTVLGNAVARLIAADATPNLVPKKRTLALELPPRAADLVQWALELGTRAGTLDKIWTAPSTLFANSTDPGQADVLFANCQRILLETSFPLNLALTNSLMNGSSFELVREWLAESRVRDLKLTDEPTQDEEGYPIDLLLTELVIFSRRFAQGVLYVPWVAPVQGPREEGELPAFGIVMVATPYSHAADNSAAGLDVTRAAAIIDSYGSLIHSALLTGLANEGHDVSAEGHIESSIITALSLSGRCAPTPHGAGNVLLAFDPYRDSSRRFRQAFYDQPAAFHVAFARLLDAASRSGSIQQFRTIQNVLKHEISRAVTAMRTATEALCADSLPPPSRSIAHQMVDGAFIELATWLEYRYVPGHPSPWTPNNLGRSVRQYLLDVTKLELESFVATFISRMENLKLFDVPAADASEALLLLHAVKGANDRVFEIRATESCRFLGFPPPGPAGSALAMMTSGAATEHLARWLMAAVQNALKHDAPATSFEVGFLPCLRSLREWAEARAGRWPIQVGLESVAHGRARETVLFVHNRCERAPLVSGGTKLTLESIGGLLGGSVTFDFDPSEHVWLTELRLPGVLLVDDLFAKEDV